MIRTTPPVRCLILLVAGWAGLRTAYLRISWSGVPEEVAAGIDSPAEAAMPPRIAALPIGRDVVARPTFRPIASEIRLAAATVSEGSAAGIASLPRTTEPPSPSPGREPAAVPADAATVVPQAVALPAPARTEDHWSGSAYVFVREGSGGTGLGPGGLLGGSQAAARLDYTLNPGSRTRLSLVARASTPLATRHGGEAAFGVEWRPLPGVPVNVAVERRVAIGRDGRDAWSLRAAGGVDARPLPGGLILDGYAQAGVVGARRRDLFADGAARLSRRVGLGERATLSLGAGAWGAAQPRVSRLDLGPQAVLRLPRVALAVDYRLRIAGGARPGSGVALTLSSDF